MKAFSAEVTMMDRWLGQFLDKMEELNLFENPPRSSPTTVSPTAARLHWQARQRALAEVTDIPFYIRYPEGKGAGQTSDYYASTHDVARRSWAPRNRAAAGACGQDLSFVVGERRTRARPHFSISYNDHVWARDDRYVMFSTNQGADAKLYDLQKDPGMHNDIAGIGPTWSSGCSKTTSSRTPADLSPPTTRRRRMRRSSKVPPCSKHV